MAKVYVSVGTNIEREKHVNAAIKELTFLFGKLELSPIYEAESIGYKGENYYNFVAGFETRMTVAKLNKTLKKIEADYGRKPNTPIKAGRLIDIDILTYDQVVGNIDGVQLPRGEITKNAYVLLPLADIAGSDIHPQLKVDYRTLWQQFNQQNQKLWQIEFTLATP